MSARTDAYRPSRFLPFPAMTTRHHTISIPTGTAGRICFWGGLLGAAQAAVLLVVPAVVDDLRYSYPFTPTGYTVAQVGFAVQHVALVVGLVGLVGVAGATRLGRRGAVAAACGMALLTAVELVAIIAANSALDDPQAVVVSSLYSVPTILVGLGLVAAGIGVVRAGPWTGWPRWITLVLGVYVFVVLLPAIVAPFVVGRVAIGLWMLLFAALGVALARVPR